MSQTDGEWAGAFRDALDGINEHMATLKQQAEPGAFRGEIFDYLTGEPLNGEPSLLLVNALCDMEVANDKPLGSSATQRYVGWFTCAPEFALSVAEFNRRKLVLSNLSAEAKQAGLTWRGLRDSFTTAGYRRWHALQATREVNILPADTQSIGFTVTHGTRSIRRLSLQDGLDFLARREAFDVLDRLVERTEGRRVTGIRIVRPVAPHVRANIVAQSGAFQLACSLPLLIPNPDWGGVVRFNLPKFGERVRRSDRAVLDELDLPFYQGGVLQIVAAGA